jgi:hypothetical protein
MPRGEDTRDHEGRRPIKPTNNLGSSMADLLKQMIYDSEFNDIVGIPNDVVAKPDEGQK